MKEAIQQYIEELETRVKFLEDEIKYFPSIMDNYEKDTYDYSMAVIEQLMPIIKKLKDIVGGENKKPHSQNAHLVSERPLIENSLIDTEETKTENWRLTKYP